MKKVYKCPFDKSKFNNLNQLIQYVEKQHAQSLPSQNPTSQALFNLRNKLPIDNTHGKSIMQGKPTEWDPSMNKYKRLVDDVEREQFREMFKSRMTKVYGKIHLLDDPEKQKEMLASRSISGTYNLNGKKITYTGSYEKDFLDVMNFLDWDASDIMMPAPQVIPYVSPRDNQLHQYIPDVYIVQLNLIIEIKSEDNKHYRARDKDIEFAKDDAMEKSRYNFVKVYDKEYQHFLQTIIDMRDASIAE